MTKDFNFIKLYSGYFVSKTITQGLFPLLTVLAANQGIATDRIGVYMTIIYGAILLGTMASGRLSFIGIPKKWIMFGSALFGAIGIIGMGQAHDFIGLTLSTSVLWFFSGMYSNSATILTAILSAEKNAGERFGSLTAIGVVGTIAGGFIVGPLIQHSIYQIAFLYLAAFFVLPNLILLLIKEPNVRTNYNSNSKGFRLIPNFIWMLITVTLCEMLVFVSKFTLSLGMRTHSYNLSDISHAFAWGTVFCLPFPYFMGKLSDTTKKKPLLLICYLSITVALCILLVADQYWIYIAAIVFTNIMSYASTPVMLKIAKEDYPKEYVNQAQTWTNSSTWVAGILGYLWVGFAANHFNVNSAQAAGVAIALISIVLLQWKFRE